MCNISLSILASKSERDRKGNTTEGIHQHTGTQTKKGQKDGSHETSKEKDKGLVESLEEHRLLFAEFWISSYQYELAEDDL